MKYYSPYRTHSSLSNLKKSKEEENLLQIEKFKLLMLLIILSVSPHND